MEMLQGHGRPSKYTKGLRSQYYKDVDTGDIYICKLSNEYSTIHHAPVGGYLWTLVVDNDERVDGAVSATAGSHKVYVTDGDGKPHWEDKLAYEDGDTVKTIDPKFLPEVEGLPEGGTPHQTLVIDSNGVVTWEDKLAYEDGDAVKTIDPKYLPKIDGLPEGGEPYQALVIDFNGVARWEDRLAYTAIQTSDILNETQLVSKGMGYNNFAVNWVAELNEGDTGILYWNGKSIEYTVTANAYNTLLLPANDQSSAGNYTTVKIPQDTKKLQVFLAEGQTATISIVKTLATPKTVDPKYLPMDEITTAVIEALPNASGVNF